MGSDFEITLVASSQDEANMGFNLAIEEIKRIEALISSWDPYSQTSKINQNAGKKAIVVDHELFDLIVRSIALSQITDGAFDISYASMDKIWNFNTNITELPKENEVIASVSMVGYQKIVLDYEASSVFLPQEGMKIGFGAIGKGYAADKAKELLMKQGFISGIVNASGDMSVWGRKPNGESWKVAIKNPLSKEKSFALLSIEDQAVVTSGDYEKYIELNGERYSHIINPKTGYPAKGIISATVFALKAELADALATAVFVMGVEVAINRINQLEGVDCLIVDQKGNVHQSNGIDIKFTK